MLVKQQSRARTFPSSTREARHRAVLRRMQTSLEEENEGDERFD